MDGHVSAYRLGKELSYGSCILKVESRYGYRLWFWKKLKPAVIDGLGKLTNIREANYIPVNKDMSDLVEKIRWCKNHDDECKAIGENAKKLYDKIITKKMITGYVAFLINKISDKYKPIHQDGGGKKKKRSRRSRVRKRSGRRRN